MRERGVAVAVTRSECVAWVVVGACVCFVAAQFGGSGNMALRPWEHGQRVVVDAQGHIIECETCPCASSASSGPSSAPSSGTTQSSLSSASSAPSSLTSGPSSAPSSGSASGGPPPFGGEGWYCVELWQGPEGDCVNIACVSAVCTWIADQSAWDGYFFGQCFTPPASPATMYATDGIKHATEAACQAAGCACP